MRILIDIGHPAHVHLYKNLYFTLINKGHKVLVTAKDSTSINELLSVYGISYLPIGNKKDSIRGKLLSQIKFDLRLFKLVKQHKIDLAIGSSITIAHISLISKMRSVLLDDDDDKVQPLFVKFAHPFCSTLLSPEALYGRRKRKDTIYYPGYHELAYLHPNRFTPDPGVLDEIGISAGAAFFVLRFNAFKAHHDVGVKGLSLSQKLKLVEILKPLGKIFITTEREIENELKDYQLSITPEKIHSLLYYATLFIGDSQTMTTEAALLGTPALKCNTFAGVLSVPNELENQYKLCFSFLPGDFDIMIKKTKELLSLPDLKEEWNRRRSKMLENKLDVTSFLVWFIENYPESQSKIKDNRVNLEEL